MHYMSIYICYFSQNDKVLINIKLYDEKSCERMEDMIEPSREEPCVPHCNPL